MTRLEIRRFGIGTEAIPTDRYALKMRRKLKMVLKVGGRCPIGNPKINGLEIRKLP